jgi:hypothetical protein
MKTEKSIKDERERSARKKIEIDDEVNANKEIVYNYVASRKDVVGKTCVEELGFFAKGQRYLEWLCLYGHLVRMKRTVGGKRHYVYNAVVPYVRPVIEKSEEQVLEEEVASHARVVRLIDRPYVNPEPNKRTSRRDTVAIGSSMNLFGGGW